MEFNVRVLDDPDVTVVWSNVANDTGEADIGRATTTLHPDLNSYRRGDKRVRYSLR